MRQLEAHDGPAGVAGNVFPHATVVGASGPSQGLSEGVETLERKVRRERLSIWDQVLRSRDGEQGPSG